MTSPMIQLGTDAAQAPSLSYDVPDRNTIRLGYGIPIEDRPSYFTATVKNALLKIQAIDAAAITLSKAELKVALLASSFFKPGSFRALRLYALIEAAARRKGSAQPSSDSDDIPAVLLNATSDRFPLDDGALDVAVGLIRLGLIPYVLEERGQVYVSYYANNGETNPVLFLVERCQLTSFRGRYGAGGVLNTHTLFPGESARITFQSYIETSVAVGASSSVFDSSSETTSERFTSDMRLAFGQRDANSTSTHPGIEKSGTSVLWGAFSTGSSSKGNGTTTHESHSSFLNALAKTSSVHASRVSTTRQERSAVSVRTHLAAGQEEGLVREIKNVNRDRTLNLVFRKLNQEFLSILHLVDVKLAYWDGVDYIEAPLTEMDSLLDQVIIRNPTKREAVRARIIDFIKAVPNYQELPEAIAEPRTRLDEDQQEIEYWAVRKGLSSSLEQEGFSVSVPGIILDVRSHVIQADGTIVDAFVGGGSALGEEERALQNVDLTRLQLINQRQELANRIVDERDEERASIYRTLFQPAEPVTEEEGDT